MGNWDSYRDDLDTLKIELEKLFEVRNDVLSRVRIAEEEEQQMMKPVVQLWLSNVQALETEVDDLIRQISQEIEELHPGGFYSKNLLNMPSSYEFEDIVAEKLQAVMNLIKEGDSVVADDEGRVVTIPEDEGVAENLPEDVLYDEGTIVGMESIFTKVWRCIEEEGGEGGGYMGIIGLYGMGGVGKTTLLKQIYRNMLDNYGQNNFAVVIWVSVSKELRLEKIQEKIWMKIGLSDKVWKNKNFEEKASDILKILNEKKFVLLMDELWERVDLTIVGVPFPNPENSSKIVFTTRSLEICRLMEADRQFKINCLADGEAWELFKASVGDETLRSHPEQVVDIARDISKECSGLPLALASIGRALAGDKTPQEWRDVLGVLTRRSRSTSSISGSDDQLKKDIYYNLKLSYDHLQNDMFKSCLLYCCLFPRNDKISKGHLIDCWIGEGFLDDRLGAKSQGYHIIDVFLSACLLEEEEEDDNYVKMHSWIHDMTLWITTEIEEEKRNFFVCVDADLTELPETEKWVNMTRISMTKNGFTNLENAPMCSHLQTLFLNKNKIEMIGGDFFQFMPCLKVLNLSDNPLQELPSEISNLVSLQHLDLSHTAIKSLPNQLGALKKLKCLNLESTFELCAIPPRLISTLSVLHVLRLQGCGFLDQSGEDSVVCKDARLLIEELFCLKNLSMLSIGLRNSHALQKLLSSYRLQSCIQSLWLHSLQHPKSIVISISYMNHLKTLRISECEYLEELEVDFVGEAQAQGISNFYFLDKVFIESCPNLRDLTWLILAPNLKHLEISQCSELEEIIKVWKLSECPELMRNLTPFLKLQILKLSKLPNLRSIYWCALPFPDLKEGTIAECPKLQISLPPPYRFNKDHSKEKITANVPSGLSSFNRKQVDLTGSDDVCGSTISGFSTSSVPFLFSKETKDGEDDIKLQGRHRKTDEIHQMIHTFEQDSYALCRVFKKSTQVSKTKEEKTNNGRTIYVLEKETDGGFSDEQMLGDDTSGIDSCRGREAEDENFNTSSDFTQGTPTETANNNADEFQAPFVSSDVANSSTPFCLGRFSNPIQLSTEMSRRGGRGGSHGPDNRRDQPSPATGQSSQHSGGGNPWGRGRGGGRGGGRDGGGRGSYTGAAEALASPPLHSTPTAVPVQSIQHGGGGDPYGRGRGSYTSGGRGGYSSAAEGSSLPLASTPPVASTTTAAPAVLTQSASTEASSSSISQVMEQKLSLKETAIPVSSRGRRPPGRPGYGTIGRKCIVKANHFLVQVVDRDIHHYDVSITPEITSKKVNRDVVSELTRLYRKSHLGKRMPAYDGRKSLYTAGPLPFESKEFVVKLDQDSVATSSTSKRKERKFDVTIKLASKPDLYALQQFLRSRHLDAPHEVIQVLDIVLRASSSEKYVPVRRSFFSPDLGPMGQLGDGIEYWRGFYQSLRPTQMGLSFNIDVSARGFYEPILVSDFVSKYINGNISTPLSDHDRVKVRKSFKGLNVVLTHMDYAKSYKITGISSQPLKQLMFTLEDKVTKTSVVQYFRDKYQIVLKYTSLPALQAGSDANPIYLPMELSMIAEGQRYTKRLNERQVTALLRATCQRPHERESIIKRMVLANGYNRDKLANEEFGIHVGDKLESVNARVLPPPMLNYHESGREAKVKPSLGQWNMINKKMINGGRVDFWTCVCFSTRVYRDLPFQFCGELLNMCNSKGMVFNPNPVIPIFSAGPNQIEKALIDIHARSTAEIARRGGKQLQLLIIILPDATGSYGRIKRVCETELGIVSQCCQPRQASKLSKQYFENVALKINVKVGGRNSVLNDAVMRRLPHVSDSPTIIIGAAFTHPQPGEDSSPSIAAVVASMDWPEVTKYRGLVSAQTHRDEIIKDLYTSTQDAQRVVVHGGMIRDLLRAFRMSTGHRPHKIIFYRDGVSEGQFNQVLLHEVDAIRQACSSLEPNYVPPITFIVIQKRHHTRLFPSDRNMTDRSGNIQPGTVVDTKICHPMEFDFYLNSHAGIQGTSRPTHYHVLFDENRFTADELQMLTNNLCYTYARCTRSVSIVPPAYYAHLAAFRARYYIEDDTSDGGSSSGRGSGTREGHLLVQPLPSIKENVKDVMFFC